MHPSDTAATETRAWQHDIGAWVLIAVIPGFVVSQWLALQLWPVVRPIFNATLLAAAAVVILLSSSAVTRYRLPTAAALVVTIAIALSSIVNQVSEPGILLPGAIPYVFPLVVGVSAIIWRAPSPVRSIAFGVVAAVMVALGVASLFQLILGETGFAITGQQLEYPRWWERGRATGLVMNPGRLAHLGLIGVTLAPAAGKWKWLLAISGGVAAAASGGRVVLVAVIALGILIAAARGWGGRRVMTAGLVITTAAFIFIQLAVPAARQDLVDRIDATVEEETVDVRAENLEASFDLLSDRPLLGAGPGRFGSTTAFATESLLHDEYGLLDVRSEEFVAELRKRGDTREIDVGTAQLDIGVLQVATELGALGLMATSAFAGALLWLAIRARSLMATGLVLLLGVFSLTGPGWVDTALSGTVLWWFGAGLTPETRT